MLRRRLNSFPDSTPFIRYIADGLSQLARNARAETDSLTIEHRQIHLPRLPKELDGLRIAQLTDIHHSTFTGCEVIERAVDAINTQEPDIIALTGDYISHERLYAAPCAEMLGKLYAPHGVYAILGNHDHWTDAQLVTDLFRAEGIRVLINEGFRFEINGASFWLAGVDDTMVGLEDLPLALAGSSENEMKLLLAHNPVILRRAWRAGVDLVLSGHTHGGQISWRSEHSHNGRDGRSGRPGRRLLRG
ncbi:MAG: metallophosphoesterase, partial [Pyrinomonadaceae bacterium]